MDELSSYLHGKQCPVHIIPHALVCDQCPDGYSHRWLAKVCDRDGTNGLQCSGGKVCKHNSVATKAAQAAARWDFNKNNVTACSHPRAHWQCQVCGHNWDGTIADVVRWNSGCPKCNSREGCDKQMGHRQPKEPVGPRPQKAAESAGG